MERLNNNRIKILISSCYSLQDYLGITKSKETAQELYIGVTFKQELCSVKVGNFKTASWYNDK